jgi:hypothetical protein
MSEKLGAFLVRKALITKDDLEEALGSQRIYGGRLGTNLIEVGALDIEVLSKALGEQRGYPVATVAELAAVTSATLKLVTAELASKHQALPLVLEGRRMKVAMAAPYDPQHIDGLSFALGLRVVPVIVPELRLFFEQERRYGIKREERYIRLEGEGGTLPPGVARERRRFAPKVVTKPDAIGAEISFEQMFGTAAPAPAAQPTAAAPGSAAAPAAAPAPKPAVTAPAAAAAAPRPPAAAPAAPAAAAPRPPAPPAAASDDPYAAAASEGAVAKVLLGFCTAHFRRVFLFGERDGAAGVSRGKGDGADRPQAKAVRVPLDQPSCMSSATQSKFPMVVATSMGLLDAALFGALAEPGWTMVVAAIKRQAPNRAFIAVVSDVAPDAKLLGDFASMAGRAEAALAKLGGT